MGRLLTFKENKINLVFEITDDGCLFLLHMSALKFDDSLINEQEKKRFPVLELQTTGGNQNDHHGAKHTGTSASFTLKYQRHEDYINNFGRKLEFIMQNDELSVILHYQFYDNISAVKCWSEVTNICGYNIGIEYISSFTLCGIDKEGEKTVNEKMTVMLPHNSWCRELDWKSYRLSELGYNKINSFSTKRISVQNSGTWSAKEYLPMGCATNTEAGGSLLWQIENNGSWQWEISDFANRLYLKLSGPTENENHWWKNLKPNEVFLTVPAAIAVSDGGFESALAEMTKYRRKIVRKNQADTALPVIFNDYMNCLNADPTTEKLIPVIDAAADAGAEYFCIDAGWYADGTWWDTVGEWQPCAWRFPNGIKEVLNYIKSKNMIPGMWLEIEVIGINSQIAGKFDDSCYFQRHGKKIIDHGRYQLDFSNKTVTDYATSVIDRLVMEYGVGYIKMDYNIDGGIGTEVHADSFGDGLLRHNRAYLSWMSDIMNKYPHLIVENCSSGGMRMDYAMLSVHSIQSVTDQENYIRMAPIAAAASTAVLPEQTAIWSYPLAGADENETVFNMVNAMLCRIHLSGQIKNLPPKQFALVKEGIEIYKQIRKYIPEFIPFYPLGLPDFDSEWISLGYKTAAKIFLAVWRLNSDNATMTIPIKHIIKSAEIIYPLENCYSYDICQDFSGLNISLPTKYSAGIIEIGV